jgi:hypothetical protein
MTDQYLDRHPANKNLHGRKQAFQHLLSGYSKAGEMSEHTDGVLILA